jgi:serine/threonine protein phosphatase PrpC
MDESLQSYARARLLRAKPEADHRSIEAYVTSADFRRFTNLLDQKLLTALEQFLATNSNTAGTKPAAALSEPMSTQLEAKSADVIRPLGLPDFSAEVPAIPKSASSFPDIPLAAAAASMPAPPVAATTRTPRAHVYPELLAAHERLTSMVPNPLYAKIAARPESTSPALQASTPRPPDIQTAPSIQAALPQPELSDAAFRLPNARVGVEYAHRIEPVDCNEAVVLLDAAVSEGISLTVDTSTGMVSGTPLTAGECTITVTYHFQRQSSSRRRLAIINLSVTPDPRSMWKNVASDPSAPYSKADEECSALHGSDLSIIAASKRGRSHAHVGSFRDDDYRIQHSADSGWYIAVVADGAGSAKFSRRGAAIICDEAKNRIQAALSDQLVAAQIDSQAQAYVQARSTGQSPEQNAILQQNLHTSLSRVVGNAAYYAATAIFEELAQRTDLGGVFKDYSSTALIAICKRYPFGTLCAAYWVGDGAICIYSERDGVTLLGDVDSGEYSGQTRFLDSTAIEHEALLKRTRFEIVDDMTALVLMTDGVSDAKFETEARLNRAADWHQFWEELKGSVGFNDRKDGKESKLLNWLDFWSQGNHDDRTIAIIY